MDWDFSRRDALRIGAIGAGASLAGCSGVAPLSGPNADTSPEKESHDTRTQFSFKHDGEVQLGVVLQYNLQDQNGVYQTPLTAQVFHNHEQLNLNSLELAFKGAVSPRPDIFLKSPRSGWPEMVFELNDDGWTRFSVPDLGWYGQSTLVPDFFLRHIPEETSSESIEMFFQGEFELATDGWFGGTSTLRINDKVTMPVTK